MSNLDTRPKPEVLGGRAEVTAAPVRDLLPGRRVPLGESTVVRRLLPSLGRRMIGAWCFVDHYGPDDIESEPGMQVPPHPHIGLQTVSWLHDGEVLHRDSLGNTETLRPAQLGLMTSGRAISHAEQSPAEHGPRLHGAQLWVALPEAHRNVAPDWEHHPVLPEITARGLSGTVILGSVDGTASPGTTYSPLVGIDLRLSAGVDSRLPVEPDFEYAALTMSGHSEVDGVRLEPGSLLYLGCGRTELPLRADV
ncbi:MAG: pirin family protein, partial [Micromonosporaceae bacterium]